MYNVCCRDSVLVKRLGIRSILHCIVIMTTLNCNFYFFQSRNIDEKDKSFSVETLMDILLVLFDECCTSNIKREKTVVEFVETGTATCTCIHIIIVSSCVQFHSTWREFISGLSYSQLSQ